MVGHLRTCRCLLGVSGCFAAAALLQTCSESLPVLSLLRDCLSGRSVRGRIAVGLHGAAAWLLDRAPLQASASEEVQLRETTWRLQLACSVAVPAAESSELVLMRLEQTRC